MFRYSKRKELSRLQRVRLFMEEKTILLLSDKIIVHNERMQNALSSMLNYPDKQMISLELFDYLVPSNLKENVNQKIKRDLPIVISGNLAPEKAEYIYKLPENMEANLYGVNYKGSKHKNVHYKGSYSSNEIPFVMEGSFGLIWDGTSTESCEGVFGNYLKINNPHKASLYIASGMPVIIWKEAALADFIVKNGIGFTVDSINEINRIIAGITDADYEEMKSNIMVFSKMLREGQYLHSVLHRIIEFDEETTAKKHYGV